MNRWYRMGYPPLWMCVALVAVLCAPIGFYLAIRTIYGVQATTSMLGVTSQTCALMASLSSILFAAFRLARFPATAYGEWLAQTPWTSTKRTPFGPWYPVWFDLVPLTLLGAFAAGPMWYLQVGWNHPNPAVLFSLAMFPSVVFLSVWTLGGILIARKDWQWTDLSVAAWLGGLLHFIRWPSLQLWVLAYVGVGLLGWAAFVWIAMRDRLRRLRDDDESSTAKKKKQRQKAVAGTYDILTPGYRPSFAWGETAIRYRSTIGATLVAMASFIFTTLPVFDRDTVLTCGVVPLLGGLIATAFIAANQMSHLSLLARWGRKKMVVPAYDVIWLYCFGIMLPGAFLLIATRNGLLAPSVGGPVAVAVSLFLALRLHPDHRRWSLTAPCRYVSTRRRDKFASSQS